MTDLNTLNREFASLVLQERLPEAIPVAEAALDQTIKLFGREHKNHAAALMNLASLFHRLGDFSEAEKRYAERVSIVRSLHGENDSTYADALQDLARLQRESGKPAQALTPLRDVLAIRQQTVDELDPSYADCLQELASAYYDLGHFAEGEPLVRRAAEIRALVHGTGSPEYAVSRNNLAVTWWALGRYEDSEPVYQEVLEILRSCFGEDDSRYCGTLDCLARLYRDMRRFEDAVRLNDMSCEIRQRNVADDQPEFAFALSDRAVLRCFLGKQPSAEADFRRALEIFQARLDDHHPLVARGANDLGTYYLDMGQYDRAKPLIEQAVQIRRRNHGESHPDYLYSLANQAKLAAATDDVKTAYKLMLQVCSIEQEQIAGTLNIGSERNHGQFLHTVRGSLEAFLSLVVRHFMDSQDAIAAAYQLVQQRKGLIFETQASQRASVLGGDNPQLQAMLSELDSLRRQIAQASLESARTGPDRQALVQLQSLMARKEQLETKLAEEIPERKLGAADHRAIGVRLPSDSTLVEFVRIDEFDFHAVAEQSASDRWEAPRRWKPARYVAFVIPSGDSGSLTLFDLGPADAIDQMISEFRKTMSGRGRDVDVGTNEVDVGTNEKERPSDQVGQQLREAVFDPLGSSLGRRRRIIVAADGDLARLPLEVLPDCEGGRLIDEFEFSYVLVGRDTLRFGSEMGVPSGKSIVIGNPDFDLTNGSKAVEEDTQRLHAGQQSRAFDSRKIRFKPLSGTRFESESVAESIGGELWTGADALEKRVKSVRSPRILHLATHGFFFEDQNERSERDAYDTPPGDAAAESARVSRFDIENPLLRSGLALAGANTWLRGDNVPAEAEDGLLTAEDVVGMDLLGTELVVLSACETGLGLVHAGEGVMGLQRSFLLAGARTLLMSLWSVPDEITKELMVEVYRQVLAGEGRAEALRQAQLRLKSKYPDPADWGAFVCLGDPAPLPSRVTAS